MVVDMITLKSTSVTPYPTHRDGVLSLSPKAVVTPKHCTKAWTLVNTLGRSVTGLSRSREHEFWWQSTGVTLAILMEQAHYSFEDQCRHLSVYYSSVVPELGPGPGADGLPTGWYSFMTDHFCPVEFSWDWNRTTEIPTIRYSFEPIGRFAGTAVDRLNKHAALRFVDQHHSHIEGCDLLWFRHLWTNLVSFTEPRKNSVMNKWKIPQIGYIRSILAGLPAAQRNDESSEIGHRSRAFLALELNESSLVLKSYFMPGFKAQDLGVSSMSLICSTIETLPGFSDESWQSYHTIMKFLKQHPLGQNMKPEIVATDCVSPAKSRIKIYLRSQSTSWKSVVGTLGVGDSSGATVSRTALKQLQKLWDLVWQYDSEKHPDEELPLTSHRTAGLLYYFEMRPGKPTLTSKIYLPVRHYAKGDLEVASALQEYLRSTPRKDYSSQYIASLQRITSLFSARNQERTQTYITCALLGDDLRVTSYLSPVLYRLENSAKES